MVEQTILLGNNPVAVQDYLFAEAYQEGYLRFKTDFAGKMLSDEGIYHFIAQHIYNIMHQSRENAGYIAGWMAALLENTDRAVIELSERVLPKMI